MPLTGLADAVLAEPVLAEAWPTPAAAQCAPSTSPAPRRCARSWSQGWSGPGRTVLAVTATAREAEDLVDVAGRPGRPRRHRLLPELGDAAARAAEPAQRHRRSAAGRAAAAAPPRHRRRRNGPLQVVVAPVRSVLQPQVKGLGDLEPVELAPGDTAPLEDVVRRLADAAYSRVDLVEKRGEFAVRGGIVDVFPPTEEHPLRVEFWGDDVEEIRSFSVADQRTLEQGRAAVGAAVPRAAAHRRGTPSRGRARPAPTRSWWS